MGPGAAAGTPRRHSTHGQGGRSEEASHLCEQRPGTHLAPMATDEASAGALSPADVPERARCGAHHTHVHAVVEDRAHDGPVEGQLALQKHGAGPGEQGSQGSSGRPGRQVDKPTALTCPSTPLGGGSSRLERYLRTQHARSPGPRAPVPQLRHSPHSPQAQPPRVAAADQPGTRAQQHSWGMGAGVSRVPRGLGLERASHRPGTVTPKGTAPQGPWARLIPTDLAIVRLPGQEAAAGTCVPHGHLALAGAAVQQGRGPVAERAQLAAPCLLGDWLPVGLAGEQQGSATPGPPHPVLQGRLPAPAPGG